MERPALAIDLGGTQVRAALVSSDARIIAFRAARTVAQDGPEAVMRQIVGLAAAVREEGGHEIAGIGVSAPGPLDTVTGTVLAWQPMAGFAGYPLREVLSERLGRDIVLENDGIAGAIGEWRHGAGRGCADFVYVTVSTGIGGGIISNARPLRGKRGLAGHLGHIFFRRDTPRFGGGAMVCLEDYCSGTSMAMLARHLARERPDSFLSRVRDRQSRDVFAAAAAGDAFARELVEMEASSLGIGLASIAHVLNPERIAVGGGLADDFELLEPGIRAAIDRHATAGFADVAVVKCCLGGFSGLVGAASLAFELT